MSNAFVFTEDKVRKGSEPIKTGAYQNLIVENFYFTEEHSNHSGLDYLKLHAEFKEAETDRSIRFSNFNAFYAGVIENGTWTFMNPQKEGKERTASMAVEIANSLFYLLLGQAFAPENLQANMKLVDAKAKDAKGVEIAVKAFPEVIGKTIGATITRCENGYEKDGEWVENARLRFERFFSPKDQKTAFEKHTKAAATYVKEFTDSFDEDYVEPIWDKKLIALREKLGGLKPVGAGAAVSGEGVSATPVVGGGVENLLG